VRRTDGISTEPDTWKGLRNYCKTNLPQLAGLALGFDAVFCRQKRPSKWGVSNPRVFALTLLVQLHLALTFTCLLIIASTGAAEVHLMDNCLDNKEQFSCKLNANSAPRHIVNRAKSSTIA